MMPARTRLFERKNYGDGIHGSMTWTHSGLVHNFEKIFHYIWFEQRGNRGLEDLLLLHGAQRMSLAFCAVHWLMGILGAIPDPFF